MAVGDCRSEAYINLYALIDLERIRRNLKRIKASTNADVVLMVKADAYGHGLVPVARAVENEVYSFGVATLNEGVALRRETDKEILLLDCTDEELPLALANGLTVCVGSLKQLANLAKLGRSNVKLQLKLNTGMNRFGLNPNELEEALTICIDNGLCASGCYSHLRSATSKQYAQFDAMLSTVRAKFPSATSHLCSSSSAYNNKYDVVRIGLAAYDSAMTVVSQVVQSRRLFCGDYLGYGEYRVNKDCYVAWIFGGYADGINRERPQSVYMHGVKCKPLSVCMDVMAVATPFETAVGEVVILQDEFYSPTEIAFETDTIPYTVTTKRQGRIQRIYYD